MLITIVLENEGWLNKDLVSKNKYINYVGHIYNRTDSVIEKNWRGQKYWAPFTKEQINVRSTNTNVRSVKHGILKRISM
mgnify:CR=1 FL=1